MAQVRETLKIDKGEKPRDPASRGACKRHTREIYGLSADRGRLAGRRLAGILQNYRYGSDDNRCFRQ